MYSSRHIMSSGRSLRFSNSCHEHLLAKKFRQFIWRVCVYVWVGVWVYGYVLCVCVCAKGLCCCVDWVREFLFFFFHFEVIYFAWKSKFHATAITNRSKPFHVPFCGLPNDAWNSISLSVCLSLSQIDNRKYYVYDNCVMRSSFDFTC